VIARDLVALRKREVAQTNLLIMFDHRMDPVPSIHEAEVGSGSPKESESISSPVAQRNSAGADGFPITAITRSRAITRFLDGRRCRSQKVSSVLQQKNL